MSIVADVDGLFCCGCNACAEICPRHCISMQADAKGFLYPVVDRVACIDCSACYKVCPSITDNISFGFPFAAFAAYNRNEREYLASSSGGAAHVFASYIIGLGGVVYGCTSEAINVHHIRVTEQEDLSKLQGSKYVQSNVCGLFSQIKKDLKANYPVLFVGTPCQVAGLKNYIKHIPEHLYLVDLICHGVPSQQMLHEHIAHIVRGKIVERLSFRKGPVFCFEIWGKTEYTDKVHQWHYSSEPHKDMYYKAFLVGISYRESCYHCPFACGNRCSDVTIGDFWGLQDTENLFKNGVSLLLPSTDKGLQLIEAVEDKMILKEHSVVDAIDGNEQLRHPVKRTFTQKIFKILYPYLSFDASVLISLVVKKLKSLFVFSK